MRDLRDPLIGKFKPDELLPIITDNGYHSPEESESDGDRGHTIVVRNLRWRSSTVSEFIKTFCVNWHALIHFFKKKLWRLLFYVDKNTKKGIEKRSRVHDSNTYADEEAPLNAPDWTKSGYEGPLKSLTTKVVNKFISK